MSPSVHWLVPDALDRAGSKYAKSIRLCSSFTFGRRQSPAFEPSVRPWEPLDRVFASDKACSHVLIPKALASLPNQFGKVVRHGAVTIILKAWVWPFDAFLQTPVLPTCC